MFCQDCGMEVASTYKMCPKCGGKQFAKGRPQKAREQPQPAPTFTPVEQTTVNGVQTEPAFFAVSKTKLVVMSIFTLGLYQIYWFYKNWQGVKQQDGSDIIPAVRAFFSVIFCYALFEKVRKRAAVSGIGRKPFQPGVQAAGWIFLSVVPNYLPSFLFIFGLFAVLFLLPVQHIINQVHAIESPGSAINDKFFGVNIAGIIVGGLFLLLVIIGTVAEM